MTIGWMPAAAQESPVPAAQERSAPAAAADDMDIIVTATRQGDVSVNRVPMSIVAQSQELLDQQAVKTAQDISRLVPALRIEEVNASSSNISIRGVRSETGSATTGVYIDDTALQARALRGAAAGGGVFLPPIFDLERVEVLKGPQGTLYGGSSLGGTVRFITPAPNLRDFTVKARAEVNSVDQGEMGYEGGIAVNFPLVLDRLALRVSGFHRHLGGFIDFKDRRDTSKVVEADANWREQQVFRAALAWEPSDALRITPSFYYARDKLNSLSEVYRSSPGYTTPAFGTYQDAAPAGSPPGTPGRGSPLFGRYTGTGPGGGLLPAGYVPPPGGGIVTDIPGAEGRSVFIHPEHSYPALVLGPYDTIEVTNVGDNYTGPIAREPSGRVNKMYLGSVSMDWDLGPAQIMSVTSYLRDTGEGAFPAAMISSVSVTAIPGYHPSVNTSYLFDTVRPITSTFFFDAKREAKSQEIRLTYPEDRNGLSFVAGVYYSDARTESVNVNISDRSAPREAVFNIGQTFFPIHTAEQIASNNQQEQVQILDETSMALYGEATYALTDKLKVIAGIRFSREDIAYSLRTWGLLTNAPFGVGTYVEGGTVEKPITPKISLAYQATPDNLFYATASKGYRPGGVQGQANPAICANDMAALNITETPSAFGSDSVWNYEAGAKVRLFNRALQFTGTVFHVQWNKPQTPYRLPTCNFEYVTNIGGAYSRGFDLQGSLRAAPGLTIDFALGYTDAKFTQDVLTEPNAQGDRSLLVGEGMRLLEVPEWTGSVAARYEFRLSPEWRAYAFGAYQYTGSYVTTLGPGVLSHSPDVFNAPSMDNATARVGVSTSRFDISLFVDNLFANKTLLPNDLVGRTSCRDLECSTYGTFYPLTRGRTVRPRTIGLTVTANY
ncbi:TonB-dependent receptor [Sphingobium lignivorans]|uniref:Outer membrane receptor protein involved in Fe transport n=1 Tax=Sphingobium lignivorans TaxID=2735886 RepID=A0ABR6NHY2_9SPHN|nr:TonB-dependent receptor [Sphingobium lignivorans]MBB5986706.1 outer membrane receptor protein involved in Fe transport [Sphingobium lignivorans]